MAVEISYSIMCVLFIAQAVYASIRQARIAIQFDITMAIGCAIPIGIWLEQYWILQILLAFDVLGNLFIAYKLRDM